MFQNRFIAPNVVHIMSTGLKYVPELFHSAQCSPYNVYTRTRESQLDIKFKRSDHQELIFHYNFTCQPNPKGT
jgi:hypothetical protein